jgi:autoinducer 2-degrading protein
MFTVIVDLSVRAKRVEEFLAGIHENARASLRDEAGCLRFDVHRRIDDPSRFVLHELYTDADAFYIAHRQAPHYATWRAVAERCVEPGGQVNTFASPAFPDDVPENPAPQNRPGPDGREAVEH